MADTKTTKKTTKKAVKTVEVKSLAQLIEDLKKTQADLLDAKKSHRAGELVNPHVLTVTRKSIARIKTAIAIETRLASANESRKENE